MRYKLSVLSCPFFLVCRVLLKVVHLWRHPFGILNSFKQRNIGFADWYRKFCLQLYETDYLRADLLQYALHNEHYQRMFYEDFVQQPQQQLQKLLQNFGMNFTTFHRKFLTNHMNAKNCTTEDVPAVAAVATNSADVKNICRNSQFQPDKWRTLPVEIVDYWNKSCHKAVELFELARTVHKTHRGHSNIFPFSFAQKLLL